MKREVIGIGKVMMGCLFGDDDKEISPFPYFLDGKRVRLVVEILPNTRKEKKA